MQLQGTITSIIPDGGYQSQQGYINTFKMALQTPQGAIMGQIGSKTQVYPLAVGQTIIVDITETQNGRRFKRVYPGFAGQSQAPQQQMPQAPMQTQQYHEPAQCGTSKDISIIRQCMAKAAVGFLKSNEGANVDDVIDMAEILSNWCATGHKPNTQGAVTQPQTGGDDIPF